MKAERIEIITYILLGFGIFLLIFTFVMAYIMLVAGTGILPSPDLSSALGEILGPIAEALMKIMYLGIMGWIGSIATIRGIQLIRETKEMEQTQPPKP